RERGIDAGYPRSPYIDIDPVLVKKVMQDMADLGLV
ncbi:MAG: hypothetical protein PWQ77_1995, partial [Kosmotogales bacterium]|nr:hypothetical protein [Kosmotogales bacterium]